MMTSLSLFFLCVSLVLLAVLGYYIQKLQTLRRQNSEAVRREADVRNFLSLFSQNMKNTDDIERVMMSVARHVAEFSEAQAVCIYRLEDEKYLCVQGFCGAFPPMLRLAAGGNVKPKFIFDALRRERIALGEGLIGEVAASRDPLLLEDAEQDPRLEDAQSLIPIQTLMACPLINNGKLEGVICAINNKGNRHNFSERQFARFVFMARQILIANNIIQAYASLAEQDRIAQELNFARKLQASMLPNQFPAWKQFELFMTSRPAKEVSGDFYDFVRIDEDRLLVLMVDVCGKGIPACMVMQMTRTYFHSYVDHFSSLSNLLHEVNAGLYHDTDADMYATVACCLIDAKLGTVEFARAGHTGILFHVRNHHRVLFPDGSGLGLLPPEIASFDTITLQFCPGMSVLLFTDGITEAINENGEEFGMDQLAEVFNEACINRNLARFPDHLLHILDNFTGNEVVHQADDQSLVLIHFAENATVQSPLYVLD